LSSVLRIATLELEGLENSHQFFLIGNQKAIINERKMKKQEVHDDDQQEIKETNSTTNRG